MMRLVSLYILALWLGTFAEPVSAHTDGITQARLTISENYEFTLQLVNFDVLNFVAPELNQAKVDIAQLHRLDDATLAWILDSARNRFLKQLTVLDNERRAINYQLSFPTLQQLKSQLWVKRETSEEPSFLVTLTGLCNGDCAWLSIIFPERLNQVVLKKVVIQQLHIAAGNESPNLVGGHADKPSLSKVFLSYIELGFLHIVPKGLDHILFVIGLFFLSFRFKPLLWQLSAFTLAHTVTLALSTYHVIQVPSTIVEPLIALSIAYIAIENIVLQKMRIWRPLVVFGFGLLHGMGFADVLNQIGLPDERYMSALIAFNIGVELGQLAIVALLIVLLRKSFHQAWYQRRIVNPACFIIAGIGLYWFIERLLY